VPVPLVSPGRKRLERARLERDPELSCAGAINLASAAHATGLARILVAINDHGAEPDIARGGLEADGHAVQELVDDSSFFHADDAVVRTSHADVGDVGSSFRENAFVCGGTWCACQLRR